ncbi:AAA family ATPase [Microvirga sp. TS319]|uniref:AAA family ATPase n=1 Tax=Microvirga sp. TS319 TaxID=3241165 RepID=UPI00351A1AB4
MTQECTATNRSAYRRTVIVGNSGSGKSWLAVRLARVVNGAVIDLDAIHWEPGGYGRRRDAEAARAMVREAAAGERWVIEGVYGWLAQEALPRATALIWLDLPEAECMANLRHRGLRGGGDEASFAALIAWAGEYRTRENANSFKAHEVMFDACARNRLRLRLRSREEILGFLASVA